MVPGDARTIPLNADEGDLPQAVRGLRPVLEGLSEGVTVQSPQGRVVYANPAALRALGFPSAVALLAATPQELLARWDLFDDAGRAVQPAELPGRQALQGQEAPERILRFRVRATGEERWSAVRASPLRDGSGRIVGALNLFRDVTGERHAQTRQGILAEAGALFGRTLDPQQVLADLARLAVPALADACSVEVVEEGGSIRQLALSHADPAKAALCREMARRWPPTPSDPLGAAGVIRSGRSFLLRDVSEETLAARDDEHRRMLLATEPRSLLSVPLKARGRVVGALTFTLSGATARRYTPEDAAFAEELATLAATSLDNSRLYAEAAAARTRLDEALASLHETNALRGAVLDASLDAIVAIDAEGRVTEWNAAAEATFGHAREEALGRPMADLIIPPGLRAAHAAGLQRHLRTGEARVLGKRLEMPAMRKDGSIFPAELAIVRIPGPGRPTFTAFLRDITERKLAEEALARSEERFRHLVVEGSDVVWGTGPDGQVVDMPAWRAITGQGVEEVRGEGWLDAVHPDDRPRVAAAWRDAFEARAPYAVEYRLRTAEGDYRDMSVRGVPIFEADGALREWVGTCTDVTERRRTEEALRESDARLRLALRATSDVIWDWDLKTDALSWNENFNVLFGYAPHEVEPTIESWLRRIHPEDAERVKMGLQGAIDGGAESWSDEYRFLRKDGTYAPVYDRGLVLRAGDRPARMVGSKMDLTERKRHEERSAQLLAEVTRHQRRLDSIIESVPGIVWEAWDEPDPSAHRLDFVSRHVERMLGYTVDEWLARPRFWLAAVHPDDRERVAREAAEQLAAGERGTLQFRWLRKDGEVVWVQAWGALIKDAEGRPSGVRGVAMDVSDRRRAEETMARLVAIVQDSEDAIYGKGLDGRVTDWNAGAERLYGYTKDEIVGLPIQTLVPPERIEEETRILARVTGGERVPPFETERLRKNGTRIHVSLTVSPIRRASGRIVGASAIARDVSERRRAERAAARLAAIVRDSEDAIYTKTLDGRITEWNPAAERLYGWSREEIIGQPVQTLVPPSRVEEEVRILNRIAAGERIEPFETERIRKDGTVFPVSLAASPIREADGSIVGVSAVARDITERIRAERELARRAEELAQLADALERSNKELDQFAYVTSHDLKAPLRGIANLSRWIEEDLGERVTPEARGHLELLRGRVNRMESLIDAILEYSRVGRRTGKIEPVETRRLLEDVADLLSPPEGFSIRIPDEMPTVRTERARLQQVFMNLVGNAIKHHPDRARGVVTVGVEDAGVQWRFSVADNGRGIPRRFHEKVFTIFQTLEARDKVEGTGIGLAIVKKVVESKGGRVELESDDGQGAAFRFTWPKEETGGD